MAVSKKKVSGVAKQEKPVAKKVEEVKESGKRNAQIRAMDFVPVWQACDSASEVAEHFGRDELWASSFASRLRGLGVKLKKMTRKGFSRLNVDELNALIEE